MAALTNAALATALIASIADPKAFRRRDVRYESVIGG